MVVGAGVMGAGVPPEPTLVISLTSADAVTLRWMGPEPMVTKVYVCVWVVFAIPEQANGRVVEPLGP